MGAAVRRWGYFIDGGSASDVSYAHTPKLPDPHTNSATMDQSDAFGESPTPDRSIRDAYNRWVEQYDNDENPTRELNAEVLREQEFLRADDDVPRLLSIRFQA
jgi:hypothetical protein